MQLKYYNELYFSESLTKTKVKEKIQKELESNKLHKDLYLLVLSSNQQLGIEFFKVTYLQQEFFKDKSFFVIGIAKNYEEAKELVRKIIEDVISHTSDLNVREFFTANSDANASLQR